MAQYDRAAILQRQTQRKSERKEVNARPMRTGTTLPAPTKPLAKSTKPIAKKSKKQIAQEAIYSVLAKDFKKDHPKCEANLEGCTKVTEDVHHKSSRGVNLNEVGTWIAVCRPCHVWITENSAQAIEMGLSVSRLGKVQK